MTVHQNSSLPEESFTDTVRRLAGAQKPPAKGSPAYSRFVNRKIGRVIAAAAYQVGLTPNKVTFISAGFSAATIAAIALAQPHWWVGILIAIGLLVGYAFDSADGQLARLRGGGTPAGEWLDHVVDSIKTTALHLAVLIGWYRHYDVTDVRLLLIPIGFTLVASVFFFVQILTDQLRRAHPDRAPAPADTSTSATLRSILVIPTDYGVLCGIFVLFAWQSIFAISYALLLIGTALFLCAALPKWYREIRNFRD
ncbi:CDP-alcohol phosphatidyltransferase family protein [Rhodococcus sp. ARP2]|uniref:CDP-alcohol phosphatidyltransferase family protein n=1 Tax=Rhodococcus sp. ARP2 TaxID=1661385 RepID=UPI00064C3D96|nr:CDP-alcohol phosphatidyltransferase family protein [Rhodococcus sp. ARP2]